MGIFQRGDGKKGSDGADSGATQSIVADRLAELFAQGNGGERPQKASVQKAEPSAEEGSDMHSRRDTNNPEGNGHTQVAPPPTINPVTFAAKDAMSMLENSFQLLQQQAAQQVAQGLDKVAEDLVARSTQQLQQQAEAAAAAWQKQLATLTESSLQSLAKATTEACGSEISKLVEQQVQSARQDADATVNAIKQAAKEAAERVQSAQQSAESSLQASIEEYQRRLAELSSGIEKVEKSLEDRFEAKLQAAVEPLQKKATADVSAVIDQIVQDSLTRSAQQALEQAETAAASWRKQLASLTESSLEALSKATAEECAHQVKQFFQEQAQSAKQETDAAMNSIKQTAKETLAQLQSAQGGLDTRLRLVGDYQRQLEEVSTGMENLQRKFDEQLQNNLHVFQQKAIEETASALEKTVQEALVRSAQQAQQQADAATAAWQKQLASLTQTSLQSLAKVTLEECRRQLGQMFQEQAQLLATTRTEQ